MPPWFVAFLHRFRWILFIPKQRSREIGFGKVFDWLWNEWSWTRWSLAVQISLKCEILAAVTLEISCFIFEDFMVLTVSKVKLCKYGTADIVSCPKPGRFLRAHSARVQQLNVRLMRLLLICLLRKLKVLFTGLILLSTTSLKSVLIRTLPSTQIRSWKTSVNQYSGWSKNDDAFAWLKILILHHILIPQNGRRVKLTSGIKRNLYFFAMLLC